MASSGLSWNTIFQKSKPTATNGDAISIDGSDDDLPNIDASAKTAPKVVGEKKEKAKATAKPKSAKAAIAAALKDSSDEEFGAAKEEAKKKQKASAKPVASNSAANKVVASSAAAGALDSSDDEMNVGALTNGQQNGGGSKPKKKLSVERIYQKKSQLEHILLRPDTYIGSVEKVTQSMWVWDEDAEMMVQRDITFVPGLYKIFDEILVNAADNKQRDPSMTTIKIDIDQGKNMIKIWNNGKGIPIVEHKVEKVNVPTLIFGHLLTSSNYDDTEKKVTGGRNGYGAKLCNIFSTAFTVETQCNEYSKYFKQTWSDNMGKENPAVITAAKGDDFTCITFHPDLAKFGMDSLEKDTVDLFTRRAYDIAASSRGVKVFLNGKRLPVKNFKEYVDLYIKDKVDDSGQALKIAYEQVNDRWEVAVTLSDKGFQQVSFVNSIATTKGGRHVDYVTDQMVTKLLEVLKKKQKKENVQLKPFQVKNHLWVFVNCLIENPTFDSQTKENMTLQSKSFGSKCQLGEKYVAQIQKCGIVEAVMSWMRFKAQEKLNAQCAGVKRSKLKGIPKLDDANDAGTARSGDCTLILTEGDSAKALVVAGLAVIGRDRYGVFPLRGKVLNVREATSKQIMDNAEINNLIKILGLRYKEKYDTEDSLKTLRYGKMMIMTDQDQDGSHIKGLLVNFIHNSWPGLMRQGFIEEFITPIVKVTKAGEEKAFYSLPEFEEWKQQTDNWNSWKIKYYKGLGTSTAKEAKEYFSDMVRHRIQFRYTGIEDDTSITLAFSKKKVEDRKEWLTNWMEDRKRRAQLGLPELYLYGKNTKQVTYSEFVNRELILFSNMDNERSIPSLVDGFKPGQRKVIFTCLKRNLFKEMKVAQLAGSVAEHSAYHHGEQSLMSTIINLAQNFVGSNNLNLLVPSGQFGTRLHGGKDAASPRYIFTYLSPLVRHVFNKHDDALLRHLFDDNQRIEPEWYIPILPMVLVNGAEGIGTGWSTKIPNYDIREIVKNLQRMIDGLDPLPMLPSFKNFRGTIEEVDQNKFAVSGEISVIDDQTVEITELPIRVWTQQYKEGVMETMMLGGEKTPATITDYKEYHTDTTVKFVVKMSADRLSAFEGEGLHKAFKLQAPLSTTSMVLFDANGCIKRYDCVEDILKEFFELRLTYYQKRKDYLEGLLTAEASKLSNQARFILEKIDGTIVLENKPRKEIIQLLVRRGFDSDPLKAWQEAQKKANNVLDGGDAAEGDAEDERAEEGPDFNYLVGMTMWNLSKEKKDELLKQRDAKLEEKRLLQEKMPRQLWRDDLEAFLVELDKVEQQERDDELVAGQKIAAKLNKGGAKGSRVKKLVSEIMPSPQGRRVIPRVDSAFKAKVAAAKRKKDTKKEPGADDDIAEILDFDDDEIMKPLSERLAGEGSGGAKEKKAKPAVKKAPAKPKKKVDKWNSDMSDEEDEDDLLLSDDSDSNDKIPVKPKPKASPVKAKPSEDAAVAKEKKEKAKPAAKKATSKPKKKKMDEWNSDMSDEEDEDDNDFTLSDDSDSNDKIPVKPKLAAAKPKPAVVDKPAPVEVKTAVSTKRMIDSDGEDDKDMFLDDEVRPIPAPPIAAKAKPAPVKRKKKVIDSDASDGDADFAPKEEGATKKAPAAKKAAAPKAKAVVKKKKKADSDMSDDDDGDFAMDSQEFAVAARERPGRSRAPVKYNFDESEDDDLEM